MELWEIFKDTGKVLGELYEFVKNFLLYEIELFGLTFQILDIIGVFAGVGLATFVIVLIVRLFT